MPTLLHDHVLQHGEKTVLQLRTQLAFFLQCELSPASASAVRRPEDDQQEPQQPGESAGRRKENPEHHSDVNEEGKDEEKLVLTQTEGDEVPHVEKKEDGHCGTGIAQTREHSLAGQKEHLSAVRKQGEHLAPEARGISRPLTKSEEIKGDTHGSDREEEKESKQVRFLPCDRDGDHQPLPGSCFAPFSAEKQLGRQRAAGSQAAQAEEQLPVAGGRDTKLLPRLEREQQQPLPTQAGAEVKGHIKLQREERRSVDKKTLATFLASSSPALSRLLKALFLLECLPPDPFVNLSETSMQTQRRSSTNADAVQQHCLRSKNLFARKSGDLVKCPRVVSHDNVGVSVQLLPKASVFSGLLKDVGNALLAQQQLDAARCAYTASLQLAPLCAAEEQHSRSLQRNVDHETEQALPCTGEFLCSTPHSCSTSLHEGETAVAPNIHLQHVAVLLGNRSAVHLKQHAPVAALRDATAALQADPTYLKAWFRRGRALVLLADLLHAECWGQRSAPVPAQIGVPQAQKQGAAAQQAAGTMPFLRPPDVPAAFDAACTVAAVSQYAESTLCDGGGHARRTVAGADTSCFIVERLLREEAAYSLARSATEKLAPGSVASLSSLAASSPLSSVAPSTAAAASSCWSSAFSAAEGPIRCTSSACSSSSRTSSSAPFVLSLTSTPLSWSEAHVARDGEGGVFQLGACTCEAIQVEQPQHIAAVAHGNTKEAQKSRAGKEENKYVPAVAAVATQKNLLRSKDNGSLPTGAAAGAASAAAPRPLSPCLLKARAGEFAEGGREASEAAFDEAQNSRGVEVEKREAAEISICPGTSRTAGKSSNDKQAHLTSCYNVETSKALSERRRTVGGEEAVGAAADQRNAQKCPATHETNPEVPRGKPAGASAAGRGSDCDTQIAITAAAATPPSPTPQPYCVESATVETEAAEPQRNLLDTFSVYIHPDIKTYTGGPLGTSVHWRAKSISREQREAASEPRKENPHPDAGLVLEEYPLAAYCTPTQNTMERAAVPVVRGRTQFLQQWKNYVQKEHLPRARAVCAGCFKPVGAWQQQLEGVEFVRALYRCCRLLCHAAQPAAQDRRGCTNTASEQQRHRSVDFQIDSTSFNEKAGEEHTVESHSLQVADIELEVERKCRRMLCKFLASVELVAPCSTCNAALFCCPRCRDASHHVAACRGRIGVQRGLREETGAFVLRSASKWSPLCEHRNADTEDCVCQHSLQCRGSQPLVQAGISGENCFFKQNNACTRDHLPTQGSGCLRNDAAGKSIACVQRARRENMSMRSTLTAAWGILRAATALASLVAAAFNAEAQNHGFASSTAGGTALRLPAARAAISDVALAAAAAETSFESKRDEYFTTAHDLRAAINHAIEHDAADAVRTCGTIRGDEASSFGCHSQYEDAAGVSRDRKLHDSGTFSNVPKNRRDTNTLVVEGDGYDMNSFRQRSGNESSYFCTHPETPGSPLHPCELPVAYAAGGALEDGARHLARQIFPLFLSRASSFGRKYHPTSHPITRLSAHLPADADKLCDFVLNALWVAGEFFFKATSTASRMRHDFWKESELEDSCSGAAMQKRSAASEARRVGATLNSRRHDAARVCDGTHDETHSWKDECDSLFAVESTGKGNGIHRGSDERETEREGELDWAWLRSPKVLEAALAAYGVACTNSFAITLQQDETGGWSVGRALYLFASQFNHSCSPNTLAVFDSDVPVLTSNDVKREFSRGGRSLRNVGDERKQSRGYSENQQRVHECVASGRRPGCALKLRYYGCRERRLEDGTAANERGNGGKRCSAQMEELLGEELTVSYIAVAGGKRDSWWTKRRQFLREEALFECRCLACEAWMNFLTRIRGAGPQDLPPLFPLLPDHLQSLPCRQCFSRESRIRERKTNSGPYHNTTHLGSRREDLCEGDALSSVVTLLSTDSRSRQESPVATKDFGDDSAGNSRKFQPSPVAPDVLDDVVALKGGSLLLESIYDALVVAGQKQSGSDSGEAGRPSRKACRSAGAPSSRSPRTSLQQRVTSAASLAALGHSLLPGDGTPCMVQADLRGDCRVIMQPRDSQSSDTHHCDLPAKISHLEVSEMIVSSNASSTGSDSVVRSATNKGGGSFGRTSGTPRLCEGVVEQSSGLEQCTSTSAQRGVNQVRGTFICSGSCDEVARRNQTSTPIGAVSNGLFWVCIHCGFMESEHDFDTSPSQYSDMGTIRRSVETSLRLCNEVRDPLKRGRQLLQWDKSREVQLRNLVVHMARTRGQLSHEVCTALDIWAMWATECAAIAHSAEGELFKEWSRANTLRPVEGSVEPRGNAPAEVGSRLAELQERSHSLAFRLHLGATWVHSIRFPRGWQQPELCTELYKSAALAGNAGRVREGMLLAKAAKCSGTAAYGPRHPIVDKIRQLIASFREHHNT